MLFEEDKEGFGKEAIDKLKEKARQIAENIKNIKGENEKLLREVETLKADKEALLKRLEFYESERNELNSLVKGLIDEFEQVPQ
jgi:chromosome segregation ATPase